MILLAVSLLANMVQRESVKREKENHQYWYKEYKSLGKTLEELYEMERRGE